MIELDSLKFTVDTTDLKTAITAVGDLQAAVSKLNKPLAENAKISAKMAQDNAKVAVAEEKVAQAKNKTAESQARVEAAQNRAAKASERVTSAAKQQTSVLEKNQSIYDFMLQGYSKGQATTLAAAKAQGALADELMQVGKVLQDQRKLMGGDPFDKSMQGLLSLKNALVDMDAENRIVNQGIQLTSKQYKELSRDLQRITETSIATGESFDVMATRLDAHRQKFVEVATQINKLTEVEKDRERNQRLQANAIRAIATEDEKMESILRSLNVAQNEHVTVSEKAARSIANYERNLRLAGVSGEVAATKLDKFRKSAMMVAQAEEKRKVDMLSRALAPQISDVVVSLGSGMNPMTVLLQQGLQVRDLIGLSGVAVNDLQKAFKSAASDMVSSIKGTAVALGSLLIGGLQDAGAAIFNFGAKITGTNTLLDIMEKKLFSLTTAGSLADKSLKFVFGASAGLARLIAGFSAVVLPVAAFVAMVIALKDVIKEEDELAKVLALSNGRMALSHASAIEYAKALNGVGVSTGDTMKVIAEMAKTGNLTSDSISMVTKAAVDLKTYGGVAIEDTVKSFSKMKEKPVEAILELVKTTGMVAPAVVNAVNELSKQGKTAEATALAMKTLADVNAEQVTRMKNDYTDFGMFLINLSKGIKDFFNDIFKDLFYKASPDQLAAQQLSKLTEQIEEVRSNLKFNSLGGVLQTDNSLLVSLEKQAAALRRQIESRAVVRSLTSLEQEAQDKLNNSLSRAIGLEDALKTNAQKRAEETAKANKDYDALIKAGLRTEQDRVKALATINDKYKDPKSTRSNLDKDTESIRKGQMRDVERFNDLLEENIKKKESLTQAERIYLDVVSSEDWTKKTPQQRLEIEILRDKAKAEELTAKALKERLELEDLVYQSKAAARELNFKEIETARATVVDLINQNEATREQISLIGAETGATEELAKMKLRKVIAQKQEYLMVAKNADASADAIYLMEREIELLQEQIGLIDSRTNKENFTALRDSVTDAITTGLFEGGKAGSTKLRDIIEAELRKPITVFIRAVVGDILGGGSGGSSQNALSTLLDKGTSFVKNIMNFGSNLSSQLGTSALRLGDWLATSSNNTLAGAGNWLQGSYAGIGKIGGAFGNAMMGNSLYKGLSNGYSINKGLDVVGNIASLFGPVYGAVGGLVNRAFGRKLKDTGIEGTFSGQDSFSGSNYQFYKGGWFRSDKTKYSAMDPLLQSGLGQVYGELTASNKAMGDYLGINSSERLSGFSSNVKFSTNGMNEEQIQKKLEEVLGNVAEEQAKLLLGTYETVETKYGLLKKRTKTEQVWKPSEFVKFGETAMEALTRLSGSLKAVNTFLENTNDNLLAFSLVGADMASSLVDLFGGIDNFSNVSGAYYQNFFTDQERLAKGNELLAKTFADLNIAMPSTVSAYRALVESQDLTTESGRETFTALLTLSSAFYEIKTASEEAVSTLIEEINRLRGVVSTSSVNGFEGTKASFMQAISLAQAGDSDAMASIPGLSQSLESMFMSSAGSLEDVNRFRSWLANSIGSGIPAFASGGFHSGGLRLVGENGPELEMTGPSRIFSNNDTMQMLSSEGVIRAIEVMNSNLEMLRAEVRADVQHNAKTAKLLDRVIPDGDSIKTSAL